MITILLAALTMQAQVSEADTVLPEAAVPLILQTTLDSVVPEDGILGHRPVAGRPLFLDVAQTARAFEEELVRRVPSSAMTGLDRAYQAREENAAVECARNDSGRPPGCGIADDGIFVSVLSARRAERPGEYLLNVRVWWTAVTPSGNMLQGFDMEMYLARVDGRWQVVRTGRILVAY